jgi:hypothetical protein
MSGSSVTCRAGHARHAITSTIFLGFIKLLLLVFVVFSGSSYGQRTSQVQQNGISHYEDQKVPLASLSSVGDVYVNDLRAPAESTVFAGDKVRTASTGTATFTMSGNGTLKLAPGSQVVYSGSDLFTAELDAGTVVLTSLAGGSGITLRVKNFVLVPSFPREQSVTSSIEQTPDGSFVISCSNGSAGVLTLQGRSGEFLHAGQSLRLSVSAEKAELSPAISFRRGSEAAVQRLHPGWLLLGLTGAGGVALVVDQLAQGGGKQPVSPSAP